MGLYYVLIMVSQVTLMNIDDDGKDDKGGEKEVSSGPREKQAVRYQVSRAVCNYFPSLSGLYF